MKLIPSNKTHYLPPNVQSQTFSAQKERTSYQPPLQQSPPPQEIIVRNIEIQRPVEVQRPVEIQRPPMQYQIYPEYKGEIVTSERR